MKVLITGAAGFIGAHLVTHLRDCGHTVCGNDVRPGPFVDVQSDLISEGPRGLEQEYDAICHVGGIGDVYVAAENPVLAYEANVIGTHRVVEAANADRFRKIVYASTWEVYGPAVRQPITEDHPTSPDHPYSISKLCGELAVRSAFTRVPHVCLRLGTAYGPQMRTNAVIPAFIERGLAGTSITLHGGGKQFRQFTYVTDICRAFELALQTSTDGIYNIMSPEKVTIEALADRVKGRYPAVPIERTPPREGDVSPAEVSSGKAEADLGWKPEVPFDQGFEEVAAWLENVRSASGA